MWVKSQQWSLRSIRMASPPHWRCVTSLKTLTVCCCCCCCLVCLFVLFWLWHFKRKEQKQLKGHRPQENACLVSIHNPKAQRSIRLIAKGDLALTFYPFIGRNDFIWKTGNKWKLSIYWHTHVHIHTYTHICAERDTHIERDRETDERERGCNHYCLEGFLYPLVALVY